jgi:hypothetical protein
LPDTHNENNWDKSGKYREVRRGKWSFDITESSLIWTGEAKWTTERGYLLTVVREEAHWREWG